MTGDNHDLTSLFLTAPITFATGRYYPDLPAQYQLVGPALSNSLLATLAASFLFGAWFLSPDMDTGNGGKAPESNSFQRWGWAKGLWRNYAQTHKHRGRSHFPIYGTVERLLYLALLCLFPSALLALYQGAGLAEVWAGLLAWWSSGGKEIAIVVFVGFEAAALWHLICDYVWPLNQW